MTLLKNGTLKLLIAFSILSFPFSLIVVACATPPKTTKFNGKWAFCKDPSLPGPWACLNKDDTLELRKLLIECQGGVR